VPSYLYEAIGPSGKKIQDRVEGESLAAANTSLTALGYTDIVFWQGDISRDAKELITSGVGTGLYPEFMRGQLTPAEAIASRRRHGATRRIAWALGKSLVIIIPLLAINLYFLARISHLTGLEWKIFERTLGALGLVLLLCTPSACYQVILRASVWKDWKQMRRFIRIARLIRWRVKMGIPEFELETREAFALASEGQLAQALQKMELVRAKYPMKPYLFLSRLGTVYRYAGLLEKQIDCLRQSIAAAPPGLATIKLDLATVLARGGRDIASAKQLLAEATTMGKSRIDSAGASKCQGIIAVEEKKFIEAQSSLKEAITLFSDVGSALAEWIICETKAYLCLACAGLGQRDEASRLWREIKPLLLARNERDLIQRCATAANDVSALRAQ
jgi:tetratricopeptide (TPR) repeat protein